MGQIAARGSAKVQAQMKLTEAVSKANYQVVAVHSFKYDDAGYSGSRGAIGSLSRQLADNVKGFSAELEQCLETMTEDEAKSEAKLFEKAIVEPSRRLMEKDAELKKIKFVVLIDALDECADRSFVPLLVDKWSTMPGNFGLILSTRPEFQLPQTANKFFHRHLAHPHDLILQFQLHFFLLGR